MDVTAGLTGDRWLLNRTVYAPGQQAGHYESFYQRANHPSRPLAFWIRYTIFSPAADPSQARGELWAVLFDGESGRHEVARDEFPIADCEFKQDEFAVRIGTAELGPGRLTGMAGGIGWDLSFSGQERPLLLLPPRLYASRFPKAKSLVTLPLASYSGRCSVNGRDLDVDGWAGSQNHNWGSAHTDRYAFGQVAGFDEAPETFLEVATVKTKIAGPVMTPWLTTLVLRHYGREHSLVALRMAIRAKAKYSYVQWDFASSDDEVDISGRIAADRNAFVGLRYDNPPGGIKHCLNTKIATAEVTVRDRRTGQTTELRAANRTLFEILTSATDHSVVVRA
jgi:hypothetical protein